MGIQGKYNNLSKLVEKLKKSEDPKRKYEYILWLGKKSKEPDGEILVEENKVKGCVSEVFVKATIKAGKLFWAVSYTHLTLPTTPYV